MNNNASNNNIQQLKALLEKIQQLSKLDNDLNNKKHDSEDLKMKASFEPERSDFEPERSDRFAIDNKPLVNIKRVKSILNNPIANAKNNYAHNLELLNDPLPLFKRKLQRICLYLYPEQITKLDYTARKFGYSRAGYIRLLIDNSLFAIT